MNIQMKSQWQRSGLSASMIAMLALAGCGGEFAYKRGAGVNDLNSAKLQCQSKGLEGSAFSQCMEDSGWIFHNPLDATDNDDPVIKTSVKKDYRDISNSAQVDSNKTESAAATQTTSTEQAVPKKPADPMDIFIVSSWWKAGRGADSLKSDIKQCVAKLGPEHQPDMSGTTTKATRGLLLCMKDLGWKALRAQ